MTLAIRISTLVDFRICQQVVLNKLSTTFLLIQGRIRSSTMLRYNISKIHHVKQNHATFTAGHMMLRGKVLDLYVANLGLISSSLCPASNSTSFDPWALRVWLPNKQNCYGRERSSTEVNVLSDIQLGLIPNGANDSMSSTFPWVLLGVRAHPPNTIIFKISFYWSKIFFSWFVFGSHPAILGLLLALSSEFIPG